MYSNNAEIKRFEFDKAVGKTMRGKTDKCWKLSQAER